MSACQPWLPDPNPILPWIDGSYTTPWDTTKRFCQRTIVNELSFSVAPGEVFGFLGRNGAGKTTSLRMILDIIRPDSGSIIVFDQVPGILDRTRIGFLPEERGLYRTMTAAETVGFVGQLKGMTRTAAAAATAALLERFGLADHRNKKVQELSKGMAQKVQLATALVNKPDLILLDEPFSGLDPVNQELLEKEIHLAATRGASIVFSTHVMQHAERLCNRFLVLDHGRKRFEGTLGEAQRTLPCRIKGLSDRLPMETSAVRLLSSGADSDGWSEWTAEIGRSHDPQDFLQHLTETGMVLRRFEVMRRELHDIFIDLVGSQEAFR